MLLRRSTTVQCSSAAHQPKPHSLPHLQRGEGPRQTFLRALRLEHTLQHKGHPPIAGHEQLERAYPCLIPRALGL